LFIFIILWCPFILAVLIIRLAIFFCGKGKTGINTLFLQKDPEITQKYNEALLLGSVGADAQKPTVARRCRCSSTRLG
jgi:hypothetical protein